MKYIPPKKKNVRWVSLVCMLLGGMGLVFSVTANFRYSLLIQMVSLFLFVISFEFFYRYEMTTFAYIVDEKNFVVIKSVGKKQTCVCNLALSTAIAIRKTPKKKKERREAQTLYGTVGIRYNHAQTLCPRQPYSIYFSFNDKIAEIVFEPSAQMAEAIADKIRQNDGFAIG